MIDYAHFPGLKDVYLEDSYVLAIAEHLGEFSFKLDAVLTPIHPNYHDPYPGEQYCYANGSLLFRGVRKIEWFQRVRHHYVDATGEVDLGNVDTLIFNNGAFFVAGDWGQVRIHSNSQPQFKLAT